MEYKDPEIERFEFEALTDFNEEDVKMYEYKIPKDKKFRACLRLALRRGFYRVHFTESESNYIVKTNCIPSAFKCVMERASLDKYGCENHIVADKVNSTYFAPYRSYMNIKTVDFWQAMEEGRI